MRVGSLFSGVGGFDLGLERAGFRTVAFCEIDPYCRKVLTKHWPGVPIYEDVRELTVERLRADGLLRGSSFAASRINTDANGFRLHSEKINAADSGIDAQRLPRRLCGIDVITGGFPCQDISVAGKGAGIDGERSGL